MKDDCDHDWNTASNLRLIIESETDFIGAIIPMVPLKAPVDFCRFCGLLRVRQDMLAQIRDAEAKQVETPRGAP